MPDSSSDTKERPWWMTPEVLEDGLWHKFTCPLPGYPGYVILPGHLSAEKFQAWWTAVKHPDPDDDRHEALIMWQQRRPFLSDCQIKGITTEHLEATGLKLPALQIAVWYAAITQPLVMRATSLPNWPAPPIDGRQARGSEGKPGMMPPVVPLRQAQGTA